MEKNKGTSHCLSPQLTPIALTESMSEVIDLVTPSKPGRAAAEITFFDLTDETPSPVSAQGISNDDHSSRESDDDDDDDVEDRFDCCVFAAAADASTTTKESSFSAAAADASTKSTTEDSHSSPKRKKSCGGLLGDTLTTSASCARSMLEVDVDNEDKVDKNVDNEAVDKNVDTVIINLIITHDQQHGCHAVEVIPISISKQQQQQPRAERVPRASAVADQVIRYPDFNL